MKKVLLLSCSTGQGHNSSAKAIKEYFMLQGVFCDIRDAFDFISKRLTEFISWGHSFMYRYIPGLFQWGYRFCEEHPAMFAEQSRIFRFLVAGSDKMRKCIVDGEYDTVICTHSLAAIMLTHIQKHTPLAIQTAFVATDHTCYPGMEVCCMDHNYVASKEQVELYQNTGIPASRITAAGIPVQRAFFEFTEKAVAKQKLRIGEKNNHLLVMCGSMGCGPIKNILRHLAKNLPEQAEVSVICGTNKRLYRSLNRRYKKNSRIHIVGFSNDISLYMDASDLYLTKPGGISVTEAAAKKLPMLFVNAVAGCEKYNMNFFVKMRSAATASSPRKVAAKGIELLQSPDQIRYMENRLKEYSQPDGAKRIYTELNRSKSGM